MTRTIHVIFLITFTLLLYSLGPKITWRLFRNPFCSDEPLALESVYENCSSELLIKNVTIVVTVKDTCSQATHVLSHLATTVPRDIPIIYVYPEFIGCRAVNPNIGLFGDFTVKKIPPDASPIQGFLKVRPLIKTPYVLLMHNDVYIMDPYTICELVRALDAHPEAEFAAPQLYERSENGISVPHGHHKNLHLRTDDSGEISITYDIDFDLLTQRRPRDFNKFGHPQLDFMEDHAYMGRTDTYHLYIDHMASFTMEFRKLGGVIFHTLFTNAARKLEWV